MKKVVWADLSDYGPLAAEDQGALAAVTDPHYYYDRPDVPLRSRILPFHRSHITTTIWRRRFERRQRQGNASTDTGQAVKRLRNQVL